MTTWPKVLARASQDEMDKVSKDINNAIPTDFDVDARGGSEYTDFRFGKWRNGDYLYRPACECSTDGSTK